MGDTVGVLLAAPILLTLTWKNIEQLSGARRELLLWILLAGTVAWLAFIHDYEQTGRSLPLAFLTLPLLAWVALRLGITGATLAGLGFSAVAAWGTATGHGTFHLSDAHISLFLLWSYMAITVLTELLITALQAERLQVESTLRESEDHFRTLFENAPIGQMLIEPGSLRVLECNQAVTDSLGYNREELCRLWVTDIYAALDNEAIQTLQQRLLAEEQVQFETRALQEYGEPLDVSVSAVMLHSAKGDRFHFTMVDITERKAAEILMQWDREQQATLRWLLEAVLKGEQLEETLDDCLKQLLAVSWLSILPKGGVFLMEEDGQTLRLVVSKDLSPQIMALCARVPLSHCLCGRAAASRQLQYAHCVDARHEITFPGMADHGHYSVPIISDDKLLGVLVLYLPPGFPRDPLKEQFISSVADIVAGFISRKQAEQALIDHQANLERTVSTRTAELVGARNEAERLARVKSEFLANMSHEIRTPLNAVLGFAQIGQRESKGRNKSQERFHRILDAGQLLLGVINDILDFSKIEAGKLSVESRPFQLAPVIANVASFVAEAAKQKGLAYAVDAAADLPEWVLGDTQRLQQILVNLLSNAVKFSRQGEVRLRVAREGDDLYFKVIDTGIGMSQEQIARLFNPFEQADSSTTRKYGGTGLGLAISQSLAQRMGGEISVESAPGAGSAFTLRLPLPAVAPGIEAYPGKTPATGPRLAQLRVLAAEDVEVNQMILEDMLVHEGAQVVFADNGQQALEHLEEAGVTAFDVVLMDVQMPVMDGHEATRRIRKMAPELPVIGLTAHALAEERRKCLAVGMVDCATKPIDIDTLVNVIRKHVSWQTKESGTVATKSDTPV
jgi:PAS domain S-box-containing protein